VLDGARGQLPIGNPNDKGASNLARTYVEVYLAVWNQSGEWRQQLSEITRAARRGLSALNGGELAATSV